MVGKGDCSPPNKNFAHNLHQEMFEESQSFDAADFLMPDGLSLAYHTFEGGIPLTLAKSSSYVKKIDLTETSMKNFENLKYFTQVETIILDKNNLTDLLSSPALATLQTLWLNNNSISDLPALFDDITKKFPNLRHLSIMRNPGCPGLMDIVNPDLEAIRLYRLYVLYRYPKLVVLDFEHVTEEERAEAKIRGQYAIKRRSSVAVPLPPISSPVAEPATAGPGGQEGASPTNVGGGTPEREGGGVKAASSSIKVSAPRGNSKNSEGNRFIVNSQL